MSIKKISETIMDLRSEIDDLTNIKNDISLEDPNNISAISAINSAIYNCESALAKLLQMSSDNEGLETDEEDYINKIED